MKHYQIVAMSVVGGLAGGWMISNAWRGATVSTEYLGFPEPAGSISAQWVNDDRPRNIIVFIIDGMGMAHLSLAMLSSATEPSVWRRFPVHTWYDPRPLRGPFTDSAAGATAIATGALTHPDRVGVDGDGAVLENLFELGREAGYSTGIVTDSYIWDASPAAFAAHAPSRDDAASILRQLSDADLDVQFGELEDVGEGEVPTWDDTIAMLESRYLLLDADLTVPLGTPIDQPLGAVFPEDSINDHTSRPNLQSMTELGLERLVGLSQPFLMMVESEELDSASHRNDSHRVLAGLDSIERSLQFLLDYVDDRGDTLLLVVSDHETGGLAITYDPETYPAMHLTWSTEDHTASFVPLLATGPGAESFRNVIRIWEIGDRLKVLVGG